ncbi:MAG: D-alanyl-D-alanine carboxypeptidase family protein, partial [Aridibacter sp.]
GWYLYVLLIQETLKTGAEPQTPGFAREIYEWQIKNKLKADGIIDRKTLFTFINYWQSRRIKPIVLATDEQLLTATISNFYDPTRNIELLKIEKETFAAYKKMIGAAIADKNLSLKLDEKGDLSDEEQFLKLISTYRSPEYQTGLRKKEPDASQAQIAFVSPHFTGRALDIYVGGEPVTTKDFNRAIQIKTPFYKWLVKNAEKFGFYPYFYEPWHWEFVKEK